MTEPIDVAVAPSPAHSLPPGHALQTEQVVPLPFTFTGSASEYFRIWIVNVALSIATLGIYSAWAKVRTRQYFFRHTFLDGASFDYLADPLKILKGRILVAGALGLLFVAEHISLALYAVVFLLIMAATPWVFVQANRFNARNSSWRNVRFAFGGTTKGAALAYVRGVLIAMVTLGIGASWMQWNLVRFRFENASFGTVPFRYRTKWTDFFLANFLAGMVFLGTIFVIVVPVTILLAAAGEAENPVAQGAVMLGSFASYFVLFAFLRARLANLTWGGVDIGPHRLTSDQRFLHVLWLQLSNLLAIVCTLGLAVPWAKVRNHRYRMGRLQLHAAGPLVVEALPGDDGGSAVGDAFADLGDFDVGFG